MRLAKHGEGRPVTKRKRPLWPESTRREQHRRGPRCTMGQRRERQRVDKAKKSPVRRLRACGTSGNVATPRRDPERPRPRLIIAARPRPIMPRVTSERNRQRLHAAERRQRPRLTIAARPRTYPCHGYTITNAPSQSRRERPRVGKAADGRRTAGKQPGAAADGRRTAAKGDLGKPRCGRSPRHVRESGNG